MASFAIVSAGSAAPTYATGFFEPLAQATKRVGKDVGKAASQAGKEVGKGVQNTGREVGRGVKNTGREIGRGAKNVERFGRGTKNGLVRNFEGRQPPNPYRITASRYFSDSQSIGRGAGSLGSFGFDYDTRVNNLLGGTTVIGLYADINTGGRYSRNNSAEFDADIIGVGFHARRVFTADLNKSHFYTGLGVGFYGTRYTIDPLGPARNKKTDYSPGLRLIGGYNFDKNYFVQFDLLALDSFRTRNSNGANVRVNPSGARFGFGYRF
ncbi:MAG: hypothetical protein H7Y38_06330 [Armatimonadetes bacterium]|nr:hypothetical protein [Armatimonadota bacterium]